ncbi:MAG TPA: DUF2442 domain-containing protein [Longimicrobium sp.]|nr:DUF2442 domain-containing protein [Longimicrobium sp.]
MERRWRPASLDPAELDDEYTAAVSAGIEADATQPRAVTACYDARTRTLIVGLRNGASLLFPVSRHPGLAQLRDEQLKAVHVTRSGYGLHRDDADIHVAVPQLVGSVKQ